MVLVTGSAKGIGRATALYFLERGYEVAGIDISESTIHHEKYAHHIADISEREALPEIDNIEYLILNAGVQNSGRDIDINLKGTMNCGEKYAVQKSVKSVLINASASAHTGFEFPEYTASKAGLLGYMKNLAWRLAEEGKIVNSLSFGGVLTSSNDAVLDDPKLWDDIMKITPLKKWMSEVECAEWIYFMMVKNRSCTGQDILIDNGEKDLNCTFVWPKF